MRASLNAFPLMMAVVLGLGVCAIGAAADCGSVPFYSVLDGPRSVIYPAVAVPPGCPPEVPWPSSPERRGLSAAVKPRRSSLA